MEGVNLTGVEMQRRARNVFYFGLALFLFPFFIIFLDGWDRDMTPLYYIWAMSGVVMYMVWRTMRKGEYLKHYVILKSIKII